MSKQEIFRPVGLGSQWIATGKSLLFDYGTYENPQAPKLIPCPTQEQLDSFFASSSVCSVDDLTVYEIREAHANGLINYDIYKTLMSYKK